MKAVGQLHQTARLAIALGPRHSEVMGDAGVGIGALLMSDDDAGPAAEPAEATENRLVVRERAVAGKRREVFDETGDVIGEIGRASSRESVCQYVWISVVAESFKKKKKKKTLTYHLN